MKGNYDRRKFLKASMLSLGAVFIHIPSPLAASRATTDLPVSSGPDIDGDLLYMQARDLFYRKKYTQSATLYRQLITTFPDRYMYYDGYARLLAAQQQLLEAAELYREGLSAYPENPFFMQRLSMRLYDICTGNRKAEQEFCRQHGITVLFESAVVLMLQAIQLKNDDKGFYQNLQDLLTGIEAHNRRQETYGQDTVTLSAETAAHADEALARYYAAQAARPMLLPATSPALEEKSVEERLKAIDERERRTLYDEGERLSFAENMQNARKSCLYDGIGAALEQNDISMAEHYGTRLLDVDVNDTNSIGVLRQYYRQGKDYTRIITLDRYVYMKDRSLSHALSLALSLVRYGTTSADYEEALQLTAPIGQNARQLGGIHAVNYFLTRARALSAIGRPEEAEAVLLEGLQLLNGRFGTVYILLEHYATICATHVPETANELLKTLTGRESLSVSKNSRKNPTLPVWTHADAYMDKVKARGRSVPEQLKPLYALLKLQKEDSDTYRSVLSEIRELESKAYMPV